MDRVYQYIDGHIEDFVRELEDLCRQPSVSAEGMGLVEMTGHVRRAPPGWRQRPFP